MEPTGVSTCAGARSAPKATKREIHSHVITLRCITIYNIDTDEMYNIYTIDTDEMYNTYNNLPHV